MSSENLTIGTNISLTNRIMRRLGVLILPTVVIIVVLNGLGYLKLSDDALNSIIDGFLTFASSLFLWVTGRNANEDVQKARVIKEVARNAQSIEDIP